MKKGIFYGISLLAMALLGSLESYASNPFDWQPYEQEDPTSDEESHKPGQTEETPPAE